MGPPTNADSPGQSGARSAERRSSSPPASSKQGKREGSARLSPREKDGLGQGPSSPAAGLGVSLAAEAAAGPGIAVALLLVAAWWAANGSLGFMVPALRQALAFSLLLIGILLATGRRIETYREFWERMVGGLGAFLSFLIGSAWGGELGRSWALVAAAGCLAITTRDPANRAVLHAVQVALALGSLYLTGLYTWPIFWHIVNLFSVVWGDLAGKLAGTPLRLGPTFAAIELPLVIGVIAICWLRWRGAKVLHLLAAPLVILLFHTAYLAILAWVPHFVAKLPPPPPVGSLEEYTPPAWTWAGFLRTALPWSMPLGAAIGHLIILWVVLRLSLAADVEGSGGEVGKEQIVSATSSGTASLPQRGSLRQLGPLSRLLEIGLKGRADPAPPIAPTAWVGLVGAVLIAVSLFQPLTRAPEGITVVAWKGGFLRHEVAESSDTLEMGSWGGLPLLFAGWGSRLLLSENLSAEDLRQAHIVLVVHPDKPWPEDQVRRLHDYLARGGRMLFIGGYHFREEDRTSQFQQLLKPLGLDIPFETTLAVGRAREQTFAFAYHPVLLGREKVVGKPPWGDGASLRLSWNWQPLVWARWAWGDPGTDALLTGTANFDPGEQLGDLIVAAETRFGKGRVIVWANSEIITDHNLMRHYALLGRLVSYLGSDLSPPGRGWRGILLGGGLLLLAVSFFRVSAPVLCELGAVALVALVLVHQINVRSQPVYVPDGRLHPQWNNVVAIDLGHLNHGSLSPWSPDGWGAFQLLLLRCGFLPVGVECLSWETLSRAGMLISVAPQRPFSSGEQGAVRKLLEEGGTFIALVGADRSAAVRPFLRQLGLDPGLFPVPVGAPDIEPEPMGCIHTFYRAGNVEYDSEVLFYAAWPIGCDPSEHLIRGKNNLPVAAIRPVGRGRVVLFGDSDFILNTNLEFTRQPIDGRQVNQAFWRWFLSWLTPQPDWAPPPAPQRMPKPESPQDVSPAKSPQEKPRL